MLIKYAAIRYLSQWITYCMIPEYIDYNLIYVREEVATSHLGLKCAVGVVIWCSALCRMNVAFSVVRVYVSRLLLCDTLPCYCAQFMV